MLAEWQRKGMVGCQHLDVWRRLAFWWHPQSPADSMIKFLLSTEGQYSCIGRCSWQNGQGAAPLHQNPGACWWSMYSISLTLPFSSKAFNLYPIETSETHHIVRTLTKIHQVTRNLPDILLTKVTFVRPHQHSASLYGVRRNMMRIRMLERVVRSRV